MKIRTQVPKTHVYNSESFERKGGMDMPDILRELQKGSEQALEKMIETYTGYVGTVVWNIVGGTLDRSDAEEIISDVFLSLWYNAKKVRPGKLRPYLAAVARNKSIDALRKAGKEPEFEEDLRIVSDCDPERELTKREEGEILRRTLNELPEPDRTVFIRHYYGGEKTAQIGHRMGLSPNTVQSKLKRGREKLRRVLNERGFFLEQEDF